MKKNAKEGLKTGWLFYIRRGGGGGRIDGDGYGGRARYGINES